MNKLGLHLWYVFLFFTLPVVQAALKSLHQVHMRKVPSDAGCIRHRSLLAVMCKSENMLVLALLITNICGRRETNMLST